MRAFDEMNEKRSKKSLSCSGLWEKPHQSDELEHCCSTTEELDHLSQQMDEEEVNAFRQMVADMVEEALGEKCQVIIDLALETYEMRQKAEQNKKEYKLVKKNVNSKK